ncbi:type II toxin-antitoxin system RelE/ParE family toxin [Mucilaginibacter myungsuensis]|uniref:Type II toxin-antitoxin system RelE/ParE family toxin n=1 Tax=Mucilaginibacter myungsuensis TaxID=649104 RepID=A0A929KUY2_9SPHI|nr:type II toxin-antitoxin system RelE/ParE family toxin [Mucilaginibacter myungsuensis]
MYKLIVRKRASNALKKAYDWYENEQIGLGNAFIEEIQDCYTKLRSHPFAYHKVEYEFRQFNLKKFPHVVVYDIDDINELVIIYSIFHPKRHTKKKFED